jgi:hypothetical protein
MVDKLKSFIRGRVSYLKAMKSDVETIFVGSIVPPLKRFIVYPNNMQEQQLISYTQAFQSDAGIYSDAVQASLFVFPDGSYGEKGFKKYIKKSIVNTMTIKGKNKSYFNFSMTPEFVASLRGANQLETLQNIKKYSCTYASIIEAILKNKNKLTFVYNTLVEGSGSILLCKLLELFKFKRANGKETTEDLRYAILTSQTTTPIETDRIISRFSSPDNMQGDYIQVIIGSRIITEGVTLKNVQEIHIATPHWNYAELAQAMARGIRLVSHNALIQAGITPIVRIYQHAALTTGVQSIDMIKYIFSERKDVSIKNIERLIKEAAFDCSLFYERNSVIGIDGTRECDYTKCDYKCDGIINMDDTNIDYSTFDLYYANENIKKLIETLKQLFEKRFSYTIRELLSVIRGKFNIFELFTSIRKIISENIYIKNCYGINCYLREDSDIIFLVESLSSGLDLFYSKYPVVTVSNKYETLLDELIISNTQTRLIDALTIDEFKMNILELPVHIQRLYIESALSSDNDTRSRRFILEIFKNNINPAKDKYTLQGETYCFINNNWELCGEDEPKIIVEEENPYEYEGLINETDSMFCVRKKVDSARTTGRVCMSWDIKDLIEAAMKLKIQYGDIITINKKEINIQQVQKEELGEILKSSSKFGALKHVIDLEDVDGMRRAIFYMNSKKNILCDNLKEWFKSKNLLKESTLCGKK